MLMAFRLTLVYTFAILFHMSLYKCLGDGPAWANYGNRNYEYYKHCWW